MIAVSVDPSVGNTENLYSVEARGSIVINLPVNCRDCIFVTEQEETPSAIDTIEVFNMTTFSSVFEGSLVMGLQTNFGGNSKKVRVSAYALKTLGPGLAPVQPGFHMVVARSMPLVGWDKNGDGEIKEEEYEALAMGLGMGGFYVTGPPPPPPGPPLPPPGPPPMPPPRPPLAH